MVGALDSGPEGLRIPASKACKNDHRRTRTCNLLVPSAIEAKRATIAPGSHKHRLDIANCQRLPFFSGWFWVSDDMLCTIAMI